MKSHEMYDACRSCGESVRTGLVRCWNCNAFMREDVEERYREMTSTPQTIIFSDIPADQRTEQMPARDENRHIPWAQVFDADLDSSDFSLRESDGAAVGTGQAAAADDGFELDAPATRKTDQSTAAATPQPQAPGADETAKPGPKDTPKKKEKPQQRKSPDEFDADDLVGIAMEDQRETRRRKRQKLEEARKHRILMPCSCGAWIRVHQDQAGRTVRCRQCKKPVVVPVMKKKGKEGRRKKKKVAEIKIKWLEDIRLHVIQPTDVVLKPGSLEKSFEMIDVIFHESGVHLIRYAPPAKKSFFSKAADGPPAIEEQRRLASEHITKTAKIADIPFGELQTISPEQVGQIRLIQPVREAHASMFAGVPVFGEGQIALYLPLALTENQQAFCSFPMSVSRRFCRELVTQFGLNVGTVENGVPAEEEFDTLTCHFSEMPIRSLRNLPYYENDPGFELELAGFICATCGIAITEDARAKKKLGGGAGKSIAKAKCPKCSNKFGDQKAWILTKTPDDDDAPNAEENAEAVLNAKPGAATDQSSADAPSAGDLQGQWQIITLGKNGNFAEPDDVRSAEIMFTIEGEKYSVTAGGENIESGTIAVDLSQNPPFLDQNIDGGPDAGKSHLGIFRMVDGRLEHCQGAIDQPRPSSFESQGESTASLAVFERVKA